MDKWLKKSHKKSANSEQDPSQSIPGHIPSLHNQRAPSPARSWDSNQEYSPSQTPISSPQFHYSQNNSPLSSPGYSYCPSPSTFPSTCPSPSPFPSICPSPSPSPSHSPIPSPVPSVCPSPHGSPRASLSPSPITREPPKSPCPCPSRVRHYPEVQSQNQTQPGLTINPHRPKIRSWLSSLPRTDSKSKPTNSTYLQPTHQHGPKTGTTQNQDQSQSKARASAVLNSKHTHSHKSRPKPNFHPSSQQLSEAPKAKHTPHLEQIQSSRSSHNSNYKPSPTRAKHLAPSSRETNPSHSSHSQSTSTAVTNSNTGLNSRSKTSLKPRAKCRETTAATPVHVNPTKAQKKPQSKQQEVERREDRLSQTEGRKQERKEDRYKSKQHNKQERKEDRRLAEEQLLRRPWIQSSAEEDEEEQERVIERQRKREETARGDNSRRKEQQHTSEWETAQTKQLHCLQDVSHRQGRTEKVGRSEKEKDASPPASHSPTPQRPSFSSSASSNSDSESEYQAPITRVTADSTSDKRLSKRRQQGPGTADRPKVVHPRGPTLGNPSEGQQSEGKQKLYTLVPFGRGDHVAASSQRGLRNLVVQIDLCLLKRVPGSTPNSPVKKPSSSSFSSPTKDKQREMKQVYVPDTVAKDGKRKRKVDSLDIYFTSLNLICICTFSCTNLGWRTSI